MGIEGIVVIIKQDTRIGIPAKKAKIKIRIIKVMQNYPNAMATGKS